MEEILDNIENVKELITEAKSSLPSSQDTKATIDLPQTTSPTPDIERKKNKKARTIIIVLTVIATLTFLISGCVLVANPKSENNKSSSSSSQSISTFDKTITVDTTEIYYASSSREKICFRIYLSSYTSYKVELSSCKISSVTDSEHDKISTTSTRDTFFDNAYSFRSNATGYYYITVTSTSSGNIGIKVGSLT